VKYSRIIPTLASPSLNRQMQDDSFEVDAGLAGASFFRRLGATASCREDRGIGGTGWKKPIVNRGNPGAGKTNEGI